MELSLCMIVRNEAANLARCLESVRDAVDEIVIVDTGSEDGTKEIAARYTDRILDFEWTDDFSAARNASLRAATKPYALWLDADDMLDGEAAEKLSRLRERLDGSVDAVMLPYVYAFDWEGRPSLVFERERIIRLAAGFSFSGFVHEAMAVSGNILHEDIPVRHMRAPRPRSRRNLMIYEKQLALGTVFSPRDQYYYARELMDCGETARAEQAFGNFLSMEGGWLPNRADAMLQRGGCLDRLGRGEEAKRMYLAALGCGMPRAEALCALGAQCMGRAAYDEAVFWYRAALLCEPGSEPGAFTLPAYYDYVPLMQLCVCFDRLGRTREAEEMNERALAVRPGDGAAMRNRTYFAGLKADGAQRGGDGEREGSA